MSKSKAKQFALAHDISTIGGWCVDNKVIQWDGSQFKLSLEPEGWQIKGENETLVFTTSEWYKWKMSRPQLVVAAIIGIVEIGILAWACKEGD